MNYGVAYRDKNNKGFSETEPWINTDCDTKQAAVDLANNFKTDGCCYVCVFRYFVLPESVTYTYVDKYIVS